jgi:hypothetical protein
MKRWFIALALSIALHDPAAVSAQILPIITRDAEYNQSGVGVLTAMMATTWGGVVMQATVSFRDAAGREIDPAALSLSVKAMQGTDGLCLNFQSFCHWLALDRDSMIAIARWITSNGTGAFSAFEKELTPELMRKAGLTKAGKERIVPIEFRETSLVETLHTIDFTDLFDDQADTSAILKTRQDVSASMTVVGRGSWFNADLDSNFSARLSKSELRWTGVPLRYYWSKTSGEYVKVTEIVPLLDPAAVSAYVNRSISEEIANMQKEISETKGDDLRSLLKKELAKVKALRDSKEFRKGIEEVKDKAAKNVTLFRTVAMLRTIKSRNEKAWNAFLNDLSSNFPQEIQHRLDVEKSFTLE